MTAHEVELTVRRDGTGTLVVDGKDISNVVKGVSVEACVGEPPRVYVDLVSSAVVKASGAQFELTGDAVAMLEALGWTPPQGGVR